MAKTIANSISLIFAIEVKAGENEVATLFLSLSCSLSNDPNEMRTKYEERKRANFNEKWNRIRLSIVLY